VYLRGGFALDAAESGFVVAAERPLSLGPWNEQGQPFYGHAVSYAQVFDVRKKDGTFRVRLNRWHGSVARVKVNGSAAGFILSAPWTLDVTGSIRPGDNRIEVEVVGTLKNTLGPHHGDPAPGTAWPAMFQKGPASGPPPGDRYSTLGYGLFEPFVLVQSVPAPAGAAVQESSPGPERERQKD
jgi:hypothetical protein